MSSFTDSVVLVTGGGGDIGRAVVTRFVRLGARVVSADLVYPEVRREALASGANPLQVRLDVRFAHQVAGLIDGLVAATGRLDVVVNAAGTLNVKAFLALTESDWDETLAVNLKGTFFVCQRALGHMIERRRGSIVNIASLSGKVGGVLAAADYSASKAAVICLTKSLAKAGAPHGIRANSVAPGAVVSSMLDLYRGKFPDQLAAAEAAHPLSRFADPDEVAQAVVYLASEAASYITGACLDVNGGSLMD
jgi:3-oxoacyl-[acyl-carrier protein] reductase